MQQVKHTSKINSHYSILLIMKNKVLLLLLFATAGLHAQNAENAKFTLPQAIDYALKNGILKYKDTGQIKDIKLNTSNWEEKKPSAITHTLFG